jgi:threonine/homoserine/homoserine lactone efflux protein
MQIMELIAVGIIVSIAAVYLIYLGIRTFRKKPDMCSTDCGCGIKEKH